MQTSDLDIFKAWFSEYTRTFYTDNGEDSRNIDLKVRHTYLVCENIVRIAKEEHLSDNDLMIAETAALFHDQQNVLFLQLIRDADKLDIWRIFVEYYEGPEDKKASAVGLGLPDLPDY